MKSIDVLLALLIIFQFNTNLVLTQRDFPNPAILDPNPCACDIQASTCNPNCCCDPNCDDADLSVSPVCNSTGRTVSSYSANIEKQLQTWNCSNDTSAALYDYFPFVCVQLKLNEIIGEFYPTDNITFLTSSDSVTNLQQTFINDYPELFQSPITLSNTLPSNYSIGSPVRLSSGSITTLPGNLISSTCQSAAPILFGINRDVTCSSDASSNLCTSVSSLTSVWNGAGTSTVNVSFYTASYTAPTTTNIGSNPGEHYFQDGYTFTISNINYTNGSINDYCPGFYPLTRSQRYDGTCIANTTYMCSGSSSSNYRTWSGCPLRDTFSYTAIPDSFFTAVNSLTNSTPTYTNVQNISCPSTILQILYQFSYSSVNNIISSVSAYVLTGSSSNNTRIIIQWIDTANAAASNTTIPQSYNAGDTLQFRRNGNPSYVAYPVSNSNGYCVDATRQTLQYKQSTSSSCFIQLSQATMKQCHNLNLNMYIYLNVFYAPATDVLSYPNGNENVTLRDSTQDSLDLDQIDITRPNDRLSINTISKTALTNQAFTIYDTKNYLPICFNVPSGIYVEFGYVRVQVSSTVSFERIVFVQFNYTYSDWQFDCTTGSCYDNSTQKYLVTFQSAFVDYTDALIRRTDITTSDIVSADNYIQDLLWLITPEYTGEPGYRNYTIAMILIFTAISGVVLHVLLFGIMCPF